MADNGTFQEYLKIRGGVKYLSGGREYSYAEAAELLRSPDPFERVRAWEILQGGWAGLEGELAALLGRAVAEKKVRKSSEVFGEESGPLLAAAFALRAQLLRALELKAGRVGAPGFRYCDIWARLPAPADAQMPLAEGLRRLGLVFEKTVEGGRGLIMEFFPGNRLLLEGEAPRCSQADPASPALVYLPDNFRGVYPSDLPVIAHELGHAVHCDMSAGRPPGADILPVYSELLSHFFEESAWVGLIEGSDAHTAGELGLNRLSQLTSDFLLVPAGLEFEEAVASAAAAGVLTPRVIEDLEKDIFVKWFGVDPEGAGFWMRSARLFDEDAPFDGFSRLAGRFLSLGLRGGGGALARSALEGAVADTWSLDLKGWLGKRAAGGWSAVSSGALDSISGLA